MASLIDQTLNESSVPAFRCEGWGGGFPFSADQTKGRIRQSGKSKTDGRLTARTDRTIDLKRPHVWPQTTARLGLNDRTIQLQRALQFLSVFTGGIAGYLLELMIEMGETVVAAVVCHLADIDVFVDQQFGCV